MLVRINAPIDEPQNRDGYRHLREVLTYPSTGATQRSSKARFSREVAVGMSVGSLLASCGNCQLRRKAV